MKSPLASVDHANRALIADLLAVIRDLRAAQVAIRRLETEAMLARRAPADRYVLGAYKAGVK